MDVPALHGNWVDLGIIIVILTYLIGGWKRGFILGMIDFFGFILSFIIAIHFYSFFGKLLIVNFSFPQGIANAAGFLIGGILSELLYSTVIVNIFVRKFYFKIIRKYQDNKQAETILRVDKFFGFVPSVGEALVFITFILTLLISLPIQGVIKNDISISKIGGPLVSRTQGIERQLNMIFGEAVNETLNFLTISPNPASGETVKLHFKQTQVKIDESAETKMLSLINQERAKKGLRHLSISFELQELARDYAKDMLAKGYFSHNNPEGQSPFVRMEQVDITYGVAGENLALAPNVQLAHQGLMNSKGHRENILSPDFNKVGIGVIDGGIYGEMFVQEFTD